MEKATLNDLGDAKKVVIEKGNTALGSSGNHMISTLAGRCSNYMMALFSTQLSVTSAALRLWRLSPNKGEPRAVAEDRERADVAGMPDVQRLAKEDGKAPGGKPPVVFCFQLSELLDEPNS